VFDPAGAVLDVVLLGTPVNADVKRWSRVRHVVAGRLVNGYSSRDWLLRFFYRSVELELSVAGLMPIGADAEAEAAAATAAAAAAAAKKEEEGATCESKRSTPTSSDGDGDSTDSDTAPAQPQASLLTMEADGIENVDLSALVESHSDYQSKLGEICTALKIDL
jgi:hypothetical protein